MGGWRRGLKTSGLNRRRQENESKREKKIGTGWQREGGRAFPRHP